MSPNRGIRFFDGGVGLAICKKILDIYGGFSASECVPECRPLPLFPNSKTIMNLALP